MGRDMVRKTQHRKLHRRRLRYKQLLGIKKARLQPSTQENRQRDTDPETGIHKRRTRGKGL